MLRFDRIGVAKQIDHFIFAEPFWPDSFRIGLHLFDVFFRLLRFANREKTVNSDEMMAYVVLVDCCLSLRFVQMCIRDRIPSL